MQIDEFDIQQYWIDDQSNIDFNNKETANLDFIEVVIADPLLMFKEFKKENDQFQICIHINIYKKMTDISMIKHLVYMLNQDCFNNLSKNQQTQSQKQIIRQLFIQFHDNENIEQLINSLEKDIYQDKEFDQLITNSFFSQVEQVIVQNKSYQVKINNKKTTIQKYNNNEQQFDYITWLICQFICKKLVVKDICFTSFNIFNQITKINFKHVQLQSYLQIFNQLPQLLCLTLNKTAITSLNILEQMSNLQKLKIINENQITVTNTELLNKYLKKLIFKYVANMDYNILQSTPTMLDQLQIFNCQELNENIILLIKQKQYKVLQLEFNSYSDLMKLFLEDQVKFYTENLQITISNQLKDEQLEIQLMDQLNRMNQCDWKQTQLIVQ